MSTHYSQVPVTSAQHSPSAAASQKDYTPALTRKQTFGAWASTLWPLVLHLIVSVGIMTLLSSYVNGRQFNLTERRPSVPLPDGTTVRLSRYTPLQSDVTTFISATLVILRLIAASWASSLCWRSVVFLLGRTGLRQQELEWMISFGVLTPVAYCRDFFIFIIAVILLATVSAQAASPILTGSITWIPSSRLVELRSSTQLSFPVVSNTDLWYGYSHYFPRREWTVRQAAGLVSLAWGRNVEKDVMKRVLPSASGLNINSTISNVTLPYFSVTVLEWVSDPDSLPEDQRNISRIEASVSSFHASRPLVLGMGTFIPDTPWNDTLALYPSVISETRLILVVTHWQLDNNATGCELHRSTIFRPLPPSMGFIEYNQDCYAFARITYSAGSALCTNCRVSSYSTVQSDSTLSVRQDFVTLEALRMMADTTALLVQMNSSIPSSWGSDIDDYIIELLSRSYSGVWTALTNYLGTNSVPLNSNFSPALPSLRAQVELKRVYIWLSIQLLTTLCGVLFLAMQFRTEYELIGDTTMTAFELDSTEVTTEDGRERLKEGGLLKLQPKDGGLKVVVETARARNWVRR